jgi:hypothetical protein
VREGSHYHSVGVLSYTRRSAAGVVPGEADAQQLNSPHHAAKPITDGPILGRIKLVTVGLLAIKNVQTVYAAMFNPGSLDSHSFLRVMEYSTIGQL